MVWVRIDDGFTSHPKLVRAGPLGIALQIAALCYSNRHLTDGFIPHAVAPTLLCWEFDKGTENDQVWTLAVVSGDGGDDVTSEYAVALMLETGLWEKVCGGYKIHGYGDFQPSRKEVQKKRRMRQKAGRAGGRASARTHGQANG